MQYSQRVFINVRIFFSSVHVVFGRVVSGEAIVKKIESQPTDANSRPSKECKIVHCGELILAKTKKVKGNRYYQSKTLTLSLYSSSQIC